MYRGEFVRLNGGADFYAADIESLRREGAASLRVFLEVCQRRGIEPRKSYSGKLNVHMPTEMYAGIAEPPLSYEPESGESTLDSKVRSSLMRPHRIPFKAAAQLLIMDNCQAPPD